MRQLSSFIGLFVTATLALNASCISGFKRLFDKHPIDFNNATADDFDYYVHGLQGFWQGYMQGLYNSNKPQHLTEACLSKDISIKIASFTYDVTQGDFLLVPEIFGDLMTVIANFDECGLEKSVEEVAKYCQYTNECTKESIFGGLAGKIF